jgi:hypothetical protein
MLSQLQATRIGNMSSSFCAACAERSVFVGVQDVQFLRCRISQNHVYIQFILYIRYFWQENHQVCVRF